MMAVSKFLLNEVLYMFYMDSQAHRAGKKWRHAGTYGERPGSDSIHDTGRDQSRMIDAAVGYTLGHGGNENPKSIIKPAVKIPKNSIIWTWL